MDLSSLLTYTATGGTENEICGFTARNVTKNISNSKHFSSHTLRTLITIMS